VFAEDVEKLSYEISKQIVDRHFVVELSTAPDTLIAHFEVEQGGLVVDSIHTACGTAPRPTSSSATITAVLVRLSQRIVAALRRIDVVVELEIVILAHFAQGIVFVRVEPLFPVLPTL
jgi:hypothetical protein